MKTSYQKGKEISIGITPFPLNVRAVFNRTVAYESMGEVEASQQDYRYIFSMEHSLPKFLLRGATKEVHPPLDETQGIRKELPNWKLE